MCYILKSSIGFLYKKARARQIKKFAGINHSFEEPDRTDIIVKTDKQTIEESKR